MIIHSNAALRRLAWPEIWATKQFKGFARVFALTAMLIAVAFNTSAKEFTYTYEGCTLTYETIDESTCKVAAPTQNLPGDLQIPSSAGGYIVVEIGSNAFYGCGMMSVTIPNSVTSIGEFAFYRCTRLMSITIPNSVTSIGKQAFDGCSNLTSVTIPNSITSIDDQTFSGCTRLMSVTIPNSVTSIGDLAFYNCRSLTSVTIPNSVTSIGRSAFYGCSSLVSVTIPNSVTSIGELAFQACSGLTSVTIPNSITSIGDQTFSGCTSLMSVTIPNSVTSIGKYAFYNCGSLTSVTIPNSVKYIGMGVFEYCNGLEKAEFASIEALCNIKFDNEFSNPLWYAHHLYINGIEIIKIEVPESVNTIGNYAFNGCSELISLSIPNSVTSLGNGVFRGCSGLTSVTIPNSVTSIVDSAFYGCSGLTSFTIPNSVTSIGNSAFAGCSGLTSFTIPNSVTSIGKSAFAYCSGLTSVIIGNSVTSISNSTFDRCRNLVKSAYPNTISNPFFDGLAVAYNPKGAIIEDGWVYGPEKTEIRFAPYYLEGDCIIPNYITSIGNSAFQNCRDLTSVIIPHSVTSIDDFAFYECNGLTSVILGNSVTSIGNSAFKSCSGLVKSAYPKTISNPFSHGVAVAYNPEGAIIEDGWVYGPEKTEIRFAPYNLEEDYIISNSVTSIGDYAFQNCSGLTRIIIPNSVSAIGNAAFSGCDSLELVKVSWNVAVNIDTSVFTVTTYSKAELYINENFPSYLETNWSLFDNIFVAGHPTKRYSDGVLSYRVIEDPNNREAIVVAGDYSSLSEVFIPERFTDDSNPSEPVRYYVTCIGAGAFKNCRNLKSIMFNDRINLTAICDEAFCGCSGLSEMTIPNSVTSIGNSAFRDCSSLSEVIIPNSVTTIGNSAFYGCSRMSSVNISESVTYIGEDAFYNCKSLKNFDFASIESLCKIQFANINSNPTINARWTCEYYPTRFDANILGNIHINGEDISDLAIPETISSIGNYTFVRFPIRSVTISNSVTTVGNSAFEGCYSLSSVTIPNSVFSIGNSAFSTCISLTSVTIPNSVKSIGNTAFSSCGSLREVSLLEGDEIDFGDEVFQEGRNLELGPIQWQTPNINKIFLGRPLSKQVFNLSYLETLTIGNSVTEIGMSIWQGATKLTNLTLGNSLTTIGDDAFSGCNSLREVVVPPSVENIGASAFAGTSLSSIIMGHNVKEIGEKAFDGCPASTVSITAPTPPTAPNNTFSNYTGKLYVQGQDAIEAYYNAYTCWDRFNSYALIEPTEMKHEGSLSYKAEPGEQIQLSATLMPEGVSLPQVFWRSTNPAVATVNHNGLVTVAADLSGVESGAKNCKIIAESLYADGPVIEFSIDTENDEIEVNGISLDRTEAMMTEGQTLKLIATVTPENATDKALDWATSDAGVTTVDQTGTVTAQHAGTATITATTANGLEAVCEVTVVAKAVEPTDITLNLTTAKIIEGETVHLTASVAPADVTDATVTWTSSDETVATVDQTGLVSGVKMGTATITATTANGLTAQCVVTVDEMTGLDGVDGADISVAVSDHLIVVTAPEDTEVEVYAINGMRVVVTREHRIEILVDGVYLVRVADRVFKVVVK